MVAHPGVPRRPASRSFGWTPSWRSERRYTRKSCRVSGASSRQRREKWLCASSDRRSGRSTLDADQAFGASRSPRVSPAPESPAWIPRTCYAAFEARAAELGLGKRVETLPGDVHTVPIPSHTFDLVLIANVLRIEEPAQAQHIIERAAEALTPNGELVVIDAFGDGSPASEKALAIYALHLAMRTARGRVYTVREVQTWLSGAGLGATRALALPSEMGPVGAVFARAG